MTTITHCFGLKSNAYYKHKNRVNKLLNHEQQIIDIIRKRRKSLPREGVRKLTKSLDKEFVKANIKLSRDSPF